MELYWEHRYDYDGMRLVTRQEAVLAYLSDIPASDRRRPMKRKVDAATYANELKDEDAWVRYADARAEIDRLWAVIERIDDECGGDVSPGYIQSIARHALMGQPNPSDRRP